MMGMMTMTITTMTRSKDDRACIDDIDWIHNYISSERKHSNALIRMEHAGKNKKI